ncbi:MAG: GNAT family N-acetyltransferase [bacterium]
MEISRFEGPDEHWDRFVWDSPGGTIFSTLRFLRYHRAGTRDFLNLAVKDGGDLVAVVAGGRVVEAGGGGSAAAAWFRSPVGASFGGPVLRDDGDLREATEVVEAMTGGLRQMGLAGVEIVLPPECYSSNRDRSLAFALGRAGYRLEGSDATSVVDLEAVGEDDLDAALLRNVRKAERGGVRVRASTDPVGFHAILSAALAAKGTQPTHSLAELESLFEIFPDRFALMEATVEDRAVGGCLVVMCNSRVGLAFYICDDREHAHLRISEAAIFAAMNLLKRAGYKYFDLGTVSKGSDVNWGLVRFKSKFGAATMVREHYRLRL